MGRNAQEWLEHDYPREGVYQGGITNHYNFGKRRNEVEKIDIWAWNWLEGSLKLEGFDNLKELICWGNNLTELDLTGAPKLVRVIANNNKLTNLKINGLAELEELDCSNNQLTELDINGCHKLLSLKANGNSNLDTFNLYQQTILHNEWAHGWYR